MSEIAYSVLSYASDCARKGAVPTVEQAYALADSPAASYWCMVIDSMLDMGLIKGPTVDEYINGDRIVKDGPLYITLAGEQYLQNNSEMKKAKKGIRYGVRKSARESRHNIATADVNDLSPPSPAFAGLFSCP